MNIILLENIEKVGFKDEIVTVKNGYGRNFLIPQGKAILATSSSVKVLEEKLSHIKTPITLSIIGCVVNGPGEAAMTDIGITGGGKGNNMLYLSGVQNEKVLTDDIINKVVSEVEKKASEIEK